MIIGRADCPCEPIGCSTVSRRDGVIQTAVTGHESAEFTALHTVDDIVVILIRGVIRHDKGEPVVIEGRTVPAVVFAFWKADFLKRDLVDARYGSNTLVIVGGKVVFFLLEPTFQPI